MIAVLIWLAATVTLLIPTTVFVVLRSRKDYERYLTHRQVRR